MARQALRFSMAVAVVAFQLASILRLGQAHTVPDQLKALMKLRAAATNSSKDWERTLTSWKCPTDPSDSDEQCDPCSKDWSGNWEFLHCRGSKAAYGEGSNGDFDGYVTTLHITDQELPGSPPSEFCGIGNLRELDLDGSRFTGPLPPWILTCLPKLQELDLSFNRLSGTLPSSLSSKPLLQEIKVEHNNFHGTIPSSYGDMSRLRVLRIAYNHFSGTIPQSFSKLTKLLNELDISHNDLEGDLSPLAKARPMIATTSYNARLCGMVPAGVRFAHGYDPRGTRLGQPCD